MTTSSDFEPMRRAIQLARQGEGYVEPNPMVGCVLINKGVVVGEGFHQRYGEAHAEINALESAADKARDATAYVTLEPCSHTGKTGPCVKALIKADIARCVIACQDPNPEVNGKGIAKLEAAGIRCDVGVEEEEAAKLIAPFTKLMLKKRPWIIAKWAMSLDGKIATHTGNSKWISGKTSREWVHQLRGRVDGVLVGGGTLLADDPMLNARPPGQRHATRIVMGDHRPLPVECKLFESANDESAGPVMLAVCTNYPDAVAQQHQEMGVDVWRYDPRSNYLDDLLVELGRRRMTNVLVEGGSKLLGKLLDQDQIDEVHAFVAPKLIGGAAPTPVTGQGFERIADLNAFAKLEAEPSGDDWHIWTQRLPIKVARSIID